MAGIGTPVLVQSRYRPSMVRPWRERSINDNNSTMFFCRVILSITSFVIRLCLIIRGIIIVINSQGSPNYSSIYPFGPQARRTLCVPKTESKFSHLPRLIVCCFAFALARWRRNKRRPSIPLIIRYGDLLGCIPRNLFEILAGRIDCVQKHSV